MNSSYANDTHKITEETKLSVSVVLKLTFQVLITLFGVIGNVLVVIITSRLGRRRKPTDFYIQNLALADLGFLLLTFPIAAVKEKVPLNWPFGEFACNYLSLVPEIFYGASVWCIAVIALERRRKMLKVQTTSKSRNKTSMKRAKIMAGCVWVTSFLFFSFPLYFVVKYKTTPTGGSWCGPIWPSMIFAHVYIGLLTFFSYILPLIVISHTYFSISRVINNSSVFLRAMKQGQTEAELADVDHCRSPINEKCVRLKQNKRAKKLLTPVVLVFAATMLPLNIFRLVTAFWPAFPIQANYEDLMFTVTTFAIINSSANPVIYSIISRNFRQEIKNICGRPVARITSSRSQSLPYPERKFRGQQTSPLFVLADMTKEN